MNGYLQSKEQKAQQHRVMQGIKAVGVLDYVANWFYLASSYCQGTAVRCAFVGTNSISQGEQPSILWPPLFEKFGVQIFFGYSVFEWKSEARGAAHVHVVIIGFGADDYPRRQILSVEGDGHVIAEDVTNVSPYLFEGPNDVVLNRRMPLFDVPEMMYGSKPTDGGHLILSREEKEALEAESPGAAKWIRSYLGAREVLHGAERWCLWLVGIEPEVLAALPGVKARVEAVREFRLASKAESTRKYAAYPTLFRQIAVSDGDFVLVPRHTSENRDYIPFAFFSPGHIASDSCFIIPNASLFHFGIISSAMHMAWVDAFCGRLESRYRYSKEGIYNNFPWPGATEAQREEIARAAQGVLDARAAHPDATLSHLYDPGTMPPDLARAHVALDGRVDGAYRRRAFGSPRERVEYLFPKYLEARERAEA